MNDYCITKQAPSSFALLFPRQVLNETTWTTTIMRLSFLAFLVAASLVGAQDYEDKVGAALRKEDESYWSRLMQETEMSVAPTPPPPTLSPPTNPLPTPPPTMQSPPTPPTAPKICESDVRMRLYCPLCL